MPYVIRLFRAPAPLSRDHTFWGLNVIKGARIFFFFIPWYIKQKFLSSFESNCLQLRYHGTQVSQLISSSSFDTECSSFVCYPLTCHPEHRTTSVHNCCPTQLMAPGTEPTHHCTPSLSCCFWGSCFGDSSCPAPLSVHGFPNLGNICLQNYVGLLYKLSLVV